MIVVELSFVVFLLSRCISHIATLLITTYKFNNERKEINIENSDCRFCCQLFFGLFVVRSLFQNCLQVYWNQEFIKFETKTFENITNYDCNFYKFSYLISINL